MLWFMVETFSIIATSLGVDCTMDCLLDCAYFKEYYKFIAIDLSKQQVLDADPKAMQQISFTGNRVWLFICCKT